MNLSSPQWASYDPLNEVCLQSRRPAAFQKRTLGAESPRSHSPREEMGYVPQLPNAEMQNGKLTFPIMCSLFRYNHSTALSQALNSPSISLLDSRGLSQVRTDQPHTCGDHIRARYLQVSWRGGLSYPGSADRPHHPPPECCWAQSSLIDSYGSLGLGLDR